jgi:hypothetical protein
MKSSRGGVITVDDNTKPRLTWDGKTDTPNDYPNPAIMRKYAEENNLDRETEIAMLEKIYFPLSDMRDFTKQHCLDHTACDHICMLVKSRIAELYNGEPQF